MKFVRLSNLQVSHLQYVFSPPGLPLPAKGSSDQQTTSVLIRGGPGTGKTTLALAVGQSIAQASLGSVLYLTTEFSPIEIRFKGTLIGLRDDQVDSWPGMKELRAGSVVVQHFSALRPPPVTEHTEDARRVIIEAVWELLRSCRYVVPNTELPIRVVVIDALITLPDVFEDDPGLRSALIAFVQALESNGVSVILVEELGVDSAAWSAFVVDLVFDVAFQPDPETDEFGRKLTVSKCRYALSLPGPHDYGLENGRLTVWPDMFRVVTALAGHADSLSRAQDLPWTALPLEQEDSWSFLRESIVLSPYEGRATLLNVLYRTPGLRAIRVECGARSTIDRSMEVFDNEGMHAIAWAVHDLAARDRRNFCLFFNIESLQGRSGQTVPTIHLLEALRSLGFLVCVHGPSNAIHPMHATADFVWNDKRQPSSVGSRYYLTFARRCRPMPWIASDSSMMSSLVALESAMSTEALRIWHSTSIVPATPNPSSIERLCIATLDELSGGKTDTSLIKAGGPEGNYAAWLAFEGRADWHAARAALKSVESPEEPPGRLLQLWRAICATVGRNRSALDELISSLCSDGNTLLIDPVLRGLGGINDFRKADELIEMLARNYELAPWMIARLRADTYLDSGNTEADGFQQALTSVQALADDDSLPVVHRAEMCFDLGIVHERLGHVELAIGAFERSLVMNPFLESAQEALARVRKTSRY